MVGFGAFLGGIDPKVEVKNKRIGLVFWGKC